MERGESVSRLKAYDDFLLSKRVFAKPCGFKVERSQINPMMLDPKHAFQADVVMWDCERGKAANFLNTGLGKGPIQLEWCRLVCWHSGGDSLIVAPLAVAQQFVREAAKFSVPITLCRSQSDVRRGVNVTNYDSLDKFDLSHFAGISLDESSCFASGTCVQVFNSDNSLSMRYIQNVQTGDRILNASGEDIITHTSRTRVESAIAVTTGGRRIVSSPDHRYFTSHGWVPAGELRPGDSLVETASAVPYLRGAVYSRVQLPLEQEVLRNVLLSEMADVSAEVQRESSQSGSSRKDKCGHQEMVGVGIGDCRSEQKAHSRTESDGQSSYAREGIEDTSGNESHAIGAGRQRASDDDSTKNTNRCIGARLDAGICSEPRKEDERLSDALQTGHRESESDDRHRSGRLLALLQEGSGREEGIGFVFARVDRVEVLESGHPELEQFRQADGHVYFYDLTAARHPSFSVDGLLVHNCIKDFNSKMFQTLTERLAKTPYKLCSSATPSPNEHSELGTHAELLDVMGRSQMLAMFFEHDGKDTAKWSLKGHGKKPFFNFLSQFCVCISKPSDIGSYDDSAYVLPPLNLREHVVSVDHSVNTEGMLFRCPDMGATGIHKEMKLTCDEKAQWAASLIAEKPDEPWLIWVNTDYEAESIKRWIPRAINVKGSMSPDKKEEAIMHFLDSINDWLLSKGTIFGYGLNLQKCANMIIFPDYSFEKLFQIVRRCWRFGQTREVNAHIIVAETEGAIMSAIREKESAYAELQREMAEAMRIEQLSARYKSANYNHGMKMEIPAWLTTQAPEC